MNPHVCRKRRLTSECRAPANQFRLRHGADFADAECGRPSVALSPLYVQRCRPPVETAAGFVLRDELNERWMRCAKPQAAWMKITNIRTCQPALRNGMMPCRRNLASVR